MDNVKQELMDKLKSANNVLVSVSRNPSVDQLSALLGFTILLNKQNKHAAAVFSGEIPSTVDFLKPEDIIEENTDSLRDFIIALDKSKADKLRYKVEDDTVRIFITPYKTSITEENLEFSQGDFNVDLVVALGVSNQADLDDAITAHGRILHDATVATINIDGQGDLGSINWKVPTASSLSELVAQLVENLGKELLDEQVATALLTGIVSETQRFSNSKTTAETMAVSAVLMAAGANQQLVATRLEEAHVLKDSDEAIPQDDDKEQEDDKPNGEEVPEQTSTDGTLEILHDPNEEKPEESDEEKDALPAMELPAPADDPLTPEPPVEKLNGDLPLPPPPADNFVDGSAQPSIPEVPTIMDNLSSDPAMPPLPPSMAAPAPDQGGYLMGEQAQLPPPPPSLTSDTLSPPPPNWSPADPGPVITNPDAAMPEIKGSNSKLIIEPPTLGSALSANTKHEVLDPATDPLTENEAPSAPSLVDEPESKSDAPGSTEEPAEQEVDSTPPPPELPDFPLEQPPAGKPSTALVSEDPKPEDAPVSEEPKADSLNDIEKRIKEAEANHKEHKAELSNGDGSNNKDLNELTIDDSGNLSAFGDQEDKPVKEDKVADQARDEINKALESVPVTGDTPEPPIEALNAQPMGGELHDSPVVEPKKTEQPANNVEPAAPPVPPPITF